MEKDTASWIRDPKIEHQKKSSLPARAEHSSLPAAPQAQQLSPAVRLQACPSPQAGSTGADKPLVPSAHPEGPVVQSPVRPRRLLPPTNTPSSFRVPPRGTPGASGSSGPRKAGGRQAGIISHACSWHRVLGTSQRRVGRLHLSTLPCHSSSSCSSNPAFSSREGTLLEAAPGSHMFGKKKKQEKKVYLNILPLAGVILLLACQFGQRQRAPGICSPDVTDLGTDCARWGLISLCALMAVSERDLGQMAQPRGKERHLALVPGATGGMETQEHEARCSLPAAAGDVS